MLSLFTLTELNLNFVVTDMKSQAYAHIWPNGPCLPRLKQGRDFFLRVVRVVFLVRKLLTTIFNYQILFKGLGFRFWVQLTVPSITPNTYTHF